MKVFVDTSAWFSLYDPGELRHPQARRFFQKLAESHVELFTSDYVLDESITLIRSRINHASAVEFGNAILNSKVTRILDVDHKTRHQAWEYFIRYSDWPLSFTDCTSFALMKQRHVRHAFAFDDHFRQFGFVVVPG